MNYLETEALRFSVGVYLAYSSTHQRLRQRWTEDRGDAASSVVMMAGMAAAAILVVGIITAWLRTRASQLDDLPSTATTGG